MVPDRAGALTAAGPRAAIGRAVMEVNPGKARQRCEHAARRTRVERWAEGSGNAGLAGRELPPAEVLAADQQYPGPARSLERDDHPEIISQVLNAHAVNWRAAAEPVAERLAAPSRQIIQEVAERLRMDTDQPGYLLLRAGRSDSFGGHCPDSRWMIPGGLLAK